MVVFLITALCWFGWCCTPDKVYPKLSHEAQSCGTEKVLEPKEKVAIKLIDRILQKLQLTWTAFSTGMSLSFTQDFKASKPRHRLNSCVGRRIIKGKHLRVHFIPHDYSLEMQLFLCLSQVLLLSTLLTIRLKEDVYLYENLHKKYIHPSICHTIVCSSKPKGFLAEEFQMQSLCHSFWICLPDFQSAESASFDWKPNGSSA